MSRRLPPLVWLRAFEAAGRLESFRGAAEELNVTASAISHHVRSLERHLARPLFHRTGNRVCLTREGQAYLARLSAGFEQLAGAAKALDDDPGPRRLTIGAFPFLVSEVLLPGLAELRQRLPGVAISVVSGTRLDLLTHADPRLRVDALIRYGDGRFPACRAVKLTAVTLVPVSAPALEQQGEDDALRLVANGPRISVAGPFDGWSAWAQATGTALSPQAEVLTFDSYVTAMRAAEQGLGVGLGLLPFVDSWIDSGRISVLLDRPAPVDQASYLVTAQHSAPRPELETLTEWLVERFAAR